MSAKRAEGCRQRHFTMIGGLGSTFAGCSFLGPPNHTRLSRYFAFGLRLSSGNGGGHFLRNAFSNSWFLCLSLRVFQRVQRPLYAGLGDRERILKIANEIFYSHASSCQNCAFFASPRFKIYQILTGLCSCAIDSTPGIACILRPQQEAL